MKRIKSAVLQHPRVSMLTAGVVTATGTYIGLALTSGAAYACCAWSH